MQVRGLAGHRGSQGSLLEVVHGDSGAVGDGNAHPLVPTEEAAGPAWVPARLAVGTGAAK